MLESIRIEGYRGIKILELEELTPINIFIGPNGSGKTTVLEAISLLTNPTPYQHIRLAKCRSLHEPTLGDDHPLSSLFFAGDSSSHLSLRGHFSNQRQDQTTVHLEITPILPGTQVPIDFSFEDASQYPMLENNLLGIKHQLFINSHLHAEQTLLLNSHGGRITGLSNSTELASSFFLEAKLFREVEETAKLLSKLLQSATLKKKFLDTLQIIAPQVKDIQLGFENHAPRIYADIGQEHTISIHLLGSAFERLFHLVTGIIGTGKLLLLVDEIDSGLHYSAMEPFWHGLSGLMGEKSQLFCTTHNTEMLQSTFNVFREESVRFIRLDREDDGVVSQTSYTLEEYKQALEFGLDIR